MHAPRPWLAAGLATALAAAPAAAGDLVIGGIVFSDLDNPLLSGVNDVVITVDGPGGPYTTTTLFNGVNGFWSLTGLDAGIYVIDAALPGWCFNVRIPLQFTPGGPPPLTMAVSPEQQAGNGNIQIIATRTADPRTCANGLCTDPFFCASEDPCRVTACRPDDATAGPDGCIDRCGTGALCARGLGVCDGDCLCIDTPSCATFNDCADLDGDGRRDNPCVWWDCVDGGCVPTPIRFADLGGQFGACTPDGVVDGNDRFHALNCFANQDTVPGTPYPCETAAPTALRADAGGMFGSCVPDGVCDGNEAFLTLNDFGGISGCTCPPDGGLPVGGAAAPGPGVLDASFAPARLRLRPGDQATLDLRLDVAPGRLGGYAVALRTAGGLRGRVDIVDLFISPRVGPGREAPDWQAFDSARGTVVAGFDRPARRATGYLLSVVVRATPQAAGAFVLELDADSHMAWPSARLGAAPATIVITPRTPVPPRGTAAASRP